MRIIMTSFRVKSGKLGHQVNSDTHLQTALIQMRRLLMNLVDCPNLPDFTLTMKQQWKSCNLEC